MFKKPTRFFEELINSNGKGRTVMTALENFTPLIGGIPITVDGQIVGGVGVSGAASADQDEQLAIAGSKAFETSSTSMTGDSPAVSYWEKSKVDEAFSKGSVLFAGSDKPVPLLRGQGPLKRRSCKHNDDYKGFRNCWG